MVNSFDEFFKKAGKIAASNAVILHGEYSVDLVHAFARDTPVDEGAATASWEAKAGSEPSGNSTFRDKSQTATATAKRARKSLKNLKLKQPIFIKNAVKGEDGESYILKLEAGGSAQARNGMFYKNFFRYKQIMKKTRKRLGLKKNKSGFVKKVTF